MKPAAFRYLAPETLDEALDLLAEHGDDAKVLAGGQSLVPSMNFRLARPAVLVDINRLPDLDYAMNDDVWLRVGALARHVRFERPVTDDPIGWLLTESAHHVGHRPIRVRGTFCGSLAHADPAAEWGLVFSALEGEVTVASQRGRRTITAPELFKTVFTTTLAPDEIIVEARLRLQGPTAKVGFVESSRRAGDFAVVAVGAVLLVRNGVIEHARLGMAGVGGTPVRAGEAEVALIGRDVSAQSFGDAAQAAADAVTPLGDIHGSVEYRRHLVRVLTRRALERCMSDQVRH